MSIYRLIYCSHHAQNSDYNDIFSIHSQAVAFNQSAAITGVLCSGNSRFLQVIEGSQETILALFARIANDPRHHNVSVISAVKTSGRTFPDWSMRLIELNEFPLSEIESRCQSILGHKSFHPERMNEHQALSFLDGMSRQLSVC